MCLTSSVPMLYLRQLRSNLWINMYNKKQQNKSPNGVYTTGPTVKLEPIAPLEPMKETFKVCDKCGKDGTELEIDIHDCRYENGE